MGIIFIVEQSSCIATQPFNCFEDIIALYIQKIVEHGISIHLDTITRRELKLDFNGKLHENKNVFLTIDEFSYSLIMVGIGLLVAFVVFVCELLYFHKFNK